MSAAHEGGPGTLRLDQADPRLLDFSGRVTARSGDGRKVELDRTAFYPTAGGQPHDTGTLEGARVVDVREVDGRVVHVLDRALEAQPGAEVRGRIDPERRLDHMQQHSGQHLLSALLLDRFGLATVSVHFGAEESTIDVAAPSVSAEVLRELERAAQAAVARDLAITWGLEEVEEARARGLRRPTRREGPIRVVTIEGLDRSACGGTHVEGTARIGPILIGAPERIRAETRIPFLCGGRVLERAREDRARLLELGEMAGCGIPELPATLAARRDRLREAESELRRLRARWAALEARSRVAGLEPRPDGVLRVLVEGEDAEGDAAQALASALAAIPSVLTLILGPAGAPVLLAAAPDLGIHAGNRLRELLSRSGGRGGGSSSLARGIPGSPDGLELLRSELGFTPP